MNEHLALVLITLIGIVIPALKFLQDWRNDNRREARAVAAETKVDAAAKKVEAVREDLVQQQSVVTSKLVEIHDLVNSQLSDAVARFREEQGLSAAQGITIDELLKILLPFVPDHPLVQALVTEQKKKRRPPP